MASQTEQGEGLIGEFDELFGLLSPYLIESSEQWKEETCNPVDNQPAKYFDEVKDQILKLEESNKELNTRMTKCLEETKAHLKTKDELISTKFEVSLYLRDIIAQLIDLLLLLSQLDGLRIKMSWYENELKSLRLENDRHRKNIELLTRRLAAAESSVVENDGAATAMGRKRRA